MEIIGEFFFIVLLIGPGVFFCFYAVKGLNSFKEEEARLQEELDKIRNSGKKENNE